MSSVLILSANAEPERVRAELRRRGVEAEMLEGLGQRALLVTGPAQLEGVPGVEAVLDGASPHPRVDTAPRTVQVGDVMIGGPEPVLMAGPCAVEDEATLDTAAAAVAAAGARVLRGGAFKPRSSPYSFQGLGAEGLAILARVKALTGLGVVTEVLDPRDVEAVGEVADAFQIGARSMANFALLREVGRTRTPVLLKRGIAATVRELLLAAEYVLSGGNEQVVLCERGVRGFDSVTRNLLDVGAVAHLKGATHLPVIVDPSHAAGRADLVRPLARAGIAAGADGLLIEVHPAPGEVHSDGTQAVGPDAFARIVADVQALCAIDGRTLVTSQFSESTANGGFE
jgi:3-deoxy-7-phosphoheptulonate synthase